MPLRQACRTKRRPGMTVRDEPSDQQRSRRRSTIANTLAPQCFSAPISPKYTMSGFSIPPQAGQSTIDEMRWCRRRPRRHRGPPRSVAPAADAGDESGLCRFEQVGERWGSDHVSAGQAADLCRNVPWRSMTRRLPALGGAVDILGDDAVDPAVAFQRGERAVAGVGQGGVHMSPADVVARPVVPAELWRTQEHLDRHRRAGRGVRAAVIGDTGICRHARAGQYQRSLAGELLAELPNPRGQVWVWVGGLCGCPLHRAGLHAVQDTQNSAPLTGVPSSSAPIRPTRNPRSPGNWCIAQCARTALPGAGPEATGGSAGAEPRQEPTVTSG